MVGSSERRDPYLAFLSLGVVSTPSGVLTLYNPAHGTSLLVMTGRMDAEHADAIIELGEAMIATQAGPHASFHDYWGLLGYDTAARTRLTGWGRARRARVPEVQVLTSSKLVAMGVATAGLALSLVGTRLESHARPEGFESALFARLEVMPPLNRKGLGA